MKQTSRNKEKTNKKGKQTNISNNRDNKQSKCLKERKWHGESTKQTNKQVEIRKTLKKVNKQT